MTGGRTRRQGAGAATTGEDGDVAADDPVDDEAGDGQGTDEAPAAQWCEECGHLVEAEDLTEEGECPDCGTQLVEGLRRPVPWYFKAMLAGSVVYLGWRAYQGIEWLSHHA